MRGWINYVSKDNTINNIYIYEKTILIYLLARYTTLHHILPVRKPIDEKEEMDTGEYEEKEEIDTEEG